MRYYMYCGHPWKWATFREAESAIRHYRLSGELKDGQRLDSRWLGGYRA